MTSAAQLEYKAKAKIIKALAHPSRLFIVDELALKFKARESRVTRRTFGTPQ